MNGEAQPGAQVLLTGASSGIGWALAERLAGPECALGLVARRRERLEALAERLRSRGARALVYEADVRSAEAMQSVVTRFAAEAGGLSLVVANAGISRSDRLEEGDSARLTDLVAINVQGVINTLVPAVPLMIRAGGGHLAAVGSVAGFRGLPGKAAYCASKAALKTLMDGFRPALRRYGIAVSTICPGWVESEMTEDNPYPMPFILPTPRAAELIARALERRRRTYVFPWQMRLAVPLMRWVPERLLPGLEGRR
jgi:short-subunit dehydrogenase